MFPLSASNAPLHCGHLESLFPYTPGMHNSWSTARLAIDGQMHHQVTLLEHRALSWDSLLLLCNAWQHSLHLEIALAHKSDI